MWILSYNRLGRNADEADAEDIIDMASKASFSDQQKQVQENIHYQIKNFCNILNGVLLPDSENKNELPESCPQTNVAPRYSGLSFAVGSSVPSENSGEYLSATLSIYCVETFLMTVLSECLYSLDV